MEEKIVVTNHIAQALTIRIIFIWNRGTIVPFSIVERVSRRVSLAHRHTKRITNSPLIFPFAVIKYREAVAINHRLICLQTKSIDL